MSRRKLRLMVIAFVLAVLVTLAFNSVASAGPPSPPGGGHWYYVVRGDTWSRVSWKTGVSVWALMNANPSLVRWNQWLYVGDWMWIPQYYRPPIGRPGRGGYQYCVVPGDTWYSVSRKTGVSYYTLWNANPAYHRWNNWLYVNDCLWIPN
jgi:hypothetical protein